jgi:hypothetical protein
MCSYCKFIPLELPIRKDSPTLRGMKRYCIASLFFLFLATSSSALAEDKSLRGRLGVGFTNQIATSVDGTIPALSGKYYFSKGTAFSVGAGFDTRTANSTIALGLKLYKNLFYESNLVFYTGGGMAFVNRQGSKLQASLFLGSEFFIPQVPSLGLSFEAGIRGDNTSGSFALRTTGDSFLTAGMHFYF